MSNEGVLERAIHQLRSDAWHTSPNGTKTFYATLESVAKFNYKLIRAKYDAHNAISGQNGAGKSYAQLALIKKQLEVMGQPTNYFDAGKARKLKFIYAYNTRAEFQKEIINNSLCVFGIDELKVLFDAKRHQTREQINLYNTIEIARANLNCYIGCARNLDKIDIDYREAKVAILIIMFDKMMSGENDDVFQEARGAVLVGNPAFQTSDKFMLNQLKFANSIKKLMYLTEGLPTYVGPLLVKDYHDYGITEAEVALYETHKAKGIKESSNIIKDREKKTREAK